MTEQRRSLSEQERTELKRIQWRGQDERELTQDTANRMIRHLTANGWSPRDATREVLLLVRAVA